MIIFYNFDVIMPICISLPSLPSINNCALWYRAKDSLSLEQNTGFEILATCGVNVI